MARSHVDTSGEMVLEGYAVLFNTPSEDLGGFKEIIAPHALDGVDITDVKCLVNHDYKMIIGRTQAETLELKTDGKGLWFKCYLPDTSYAHDIYANVKAGNVTQCSFFYTLSEDKNAKTWARNNGEYVQT
ncbi:HK97 family phage prohead protease, partial [Loigolactobacillus rennini]|uniref:HK97 family phage prohead protease n=1 Tax=Loigolactobacillus rennini TaxID=238013 RepID=UPI00070AF94E